MKISSIILVALGYVFHVQGRDTLYEGYVDISLSTAHK